jgi:hypothetical protein
MIEIYVASEKEPGTWTVAVINDRFEAKGELHAFSTEDDAASRKGMGAPTKVGQWSSSKWSKRGDGVAKTPKGTYLVATRKMPTPVEYSEPMPLHEVVQ